MGIRLLIKSTYILPLVLVVFLYYNNVLVFLVSNTITLTISGFNVAGASILQNILYFRVVLYCEYVV